MKKIFLITCFIAILIFGSSATALTQTRASDYIISCSISLRSLGAGNMRALFTVQATGLMDEVGAWDILIEKKVNGRWVKYTTLSHEDYSDFLAENARLCSESQTFEGIVGAQYRAKLTAYDADDTGFDTSTATSSAKICY